MCCPGATDTVDGVLPTKSPSTSISAPLTGDSTVRLAICVAAATAAAGDPGAPDPIVGVYAQKLMTSSEPPLGAVKFLGNGTVLTSNGSEGTWKLFDADSGIDTVTIAGKRMTLTLQRGRGLVDTANKLTVFEMQR